MSKYIDKGLKLCDECQVLIDEELRKCREALGKSQNVQKVNEEKDIEFKGFSLVKNPPNPHAVITGVVQITKEDKE